MEYMNSKDQELLEKGLEVFFPDKDCFEELTIKFNNLKVGSLYQIWLEREGSYNEETIDPILFRAKESTQTKNFPIFYKEIKNIALYRLKEQEDGYFLLIYCDDKDL